MNLPARHRGAIAQLAERLDRTQEVGGSNPPSSIRRTPCTSAGSLFQDRSNRPLKSAPFQARVAEIV